SAANAALVGAKTVNGPGPFSVSTRPAALTAATSVVWSFEFTALSMMSLSLYIGAPPTVTCAAAMPVLSASATAMAALLNVLFMMSLSCWTHSGYGLVRRVRSGSVRRAYTAEALRWMWRSEVICGQLY